MRYRKCSSIVAINGRYKVKDTFNFNEVHVTKIKNQILKLNKRKYDIPTRVINLFSDVLCNNFNNLIVSKNFPQCLKFADVTPLHKKGKRTPKENYWRVFIKTIFPNLSKIYEKKYVFTNDYVL